MKLLDPPKTLNIKVTVCGTQLINGLLDPLLATSPCDHHTS